MERSQWRLGCTAAAILLSMGLQGCGGDEVETGTGGEIEYPSESYARLDQDGDGVSDQLEIFLGVEANNPYLMDNQLIQPLVNPTSDTDGDQLSDFMEVYGFYIADGSTPQALRHIITAQQWDTYKSRLAVDDYPVYQLAAEALESNSLIREDSEQSSQLVLNLTTAYDAIKQAFLDYGVPETSLLINGTTQDLGSIASIMLEFALAYPHKEPYDSNGSLPIFYTNPLLISSDWDPYTDRDEAIGLFPAGAPTPPADHPLIAALPAIKAHIESYDVLDVSENRHTLASSETDMLGVRLAEAHSHSHGFSVGFEKEMKFGIFEWGGLKTKAEQKNEWGFSSSVTNESRYSYMTLEQETDVIRNDCFAKVSLNVRFDNNGSAMASAIQPIVSLYLGDQLWRTVAADVGDGMLLNPGAGQTIQMLGQDGDAGCLTLAQFNYIEQGGLIGVTTELVSARINYYNASNQLVDSASNWQVYENLIHSNLARLDMDAVDSQGGDVLSTWWVATDSGRYPNMRLNVEQALSLGYQLIECERIGQIGAQCLLSNEGQPFVVLSDDTLIDFAFYNVAGNLLNYEDSQLRFQAFDLGENLWSAPLQPHMAVTLTDHAAEVPDIATAEIISEISGNNSKRYRVRSTVLDYFGVNNVWFCVDEERDNCVLMQPALSGQEDTPFSGFYEVLLAPGYQLTGTEYLVAKNIVNNESVLSPERFFLKLEGAMNQNIQWYQEQLDSMAQNIEAISYWQLNQAAAYNNAVSAGLIDPLGESENHYYAILERLQAVYDNCDYALSTPKASVVDMDTQVQGCLDDIAAFETYYRNNPVKVYNPVKLPLKNIYRKQYYPWTHSLQQLGGTCSNWLGGMMVGMDLGLVRDGSQISTWLRFRRIVATGKVNPLFELSDVWEWHCGGNAREKTYQGGVYENNNQFDVILDVGASTGGGHVLNPGGDIDKMCVIYRRFDIRTGQFVSDVKIRCNGNETSWSNKGGIEGFTNVGWNNSRVPNSTQLLSSIRLYSNDDTVTTFDGKHFNIGLGYNDITNLPLQSGRVYRIRSNDGDYLAATGNTDATRQISLAGATDEQLWVVEAVNDREYRLKPLNFDGYLNRQYQDNVNDPVFVARSASDDSTKAYYDQHWRMERPYSDGRYTLQSVVNHRYLSDETLKLEDSSDAGNNRFWEFELVE